MTHALATHGAKHLLQDSPWKSLESQYYVANLRFIIHLTQLFTGKRRADVLRAEFPVDVLNTGLRLRAFSDVPG